MKSEHLPEAAEDRVLARPGRRRCEPPMSADGPAAARMPATIVPGRVSTRPRRRCARRRATRVRPARAPALPRRRRPGRRRRAGRPPSGLRGDDDVHGRGEPRAGEGLRALGRDADLGVARQLVEPAVERLHREERRSDRDHHAGAGGERDHRTAHDRIAPSASRTRRFPPPSSATGSRTRSRSTRVPAAASSAGQQRRRGEHRDADDDDRADRHRPEGVDVDGEQRGERHRDRRAAEHDGGAGARERAAECLLLGALPRGARAGSG